MNIMIVGVGGQGTLLASRILGNIVIEEGYDAFSAEVVNGDSVFKKIRKNKCFTVV